MISVIACPALVAHVYPSCMASQDTGLYQRYATLSAALSAALCAIQEGPKLQGGSA